MAERYNAELRMEDRVEEIKSELHEISNVMLVMQMEREELRRELARHRAENGNARRAVAPAVAESNLRRRAL
jgi:hypothetical protein